MNNKNPITQRLIRQTKPTLFRHSALCWRPQKNNIIIYTCAHACVFVHIRLSFVGCVCVYVRVCMCVCARGAVRGSARGVFDDSMSAPRARVYKSIKSRDVLFCSTAAAGWLAPWIPCTLSTTAATVGASAALARVPPPTLPPLYIRALLQKRCGRRWCTDCFVCRTNE